MTIQKPVRTTFQEITKWKGTFEKYNDVITEQFRLGIIEEAPEDCKVGESHYLLHHAIFKDKNTSLVRIIFEASARSEGPLWLHLQVHTTDPIDIWYFSPFSNIPSCFNFRQWKIIFTDKHWAYGVDGTNWDFYGMMMFSVTFQN